MKSKKSTGNKKDGLRTVNPSGKKDDNFFQLVYEIVRQIPKGRVTSYGAIAAALGAKSSARMVGWAMNGADKTRPAVREGIRDARVFGQVRRSSGDEKRAPRRFVA